MCIVIMIPSVELCMCLQLLQLRPISQISLFLTETRLRLLRHPLFSISIISMISRLVDRQSPRVQASLLRPLSRILPISTIPVEFWIRISLLKPRWETEQMLLIYCHSISQKNILWVLSCTLRMIWDSVRVLLIPFLSMFRIPVAVMFL